jgi:pimeloyl-ACP methyl ester carboxylesterase
MPGQFVHTNRIRLHVLEHPGNGPTVVLLHGLTANAHVFDGLAVAGLAPRYRLLAPDLRGRGLSDKLPTGFTMADHAADALADCRFQPVPGNHMTMLFGACATHVVAAIQAFLDRDPQGI